MTIDWTYDARGNAFHKAVGKRAQEMFAAFRRSYSRRVPKRSGRLSSGFAEKRSRDYKSGQTVVVSVNSLATAVPYARIVEAGGRRKRYAGTRRAGHIGRVYRTERRKMNKDIKKIVEDIYGD